MGLRILCLILNGYFLPRKFVLCDEYVWPTLFGLENRNLISPGCHDQHVAKKAAVTAAVYLQLRIRAIDNHKKIIFS